ncbi:MAG: hypothetical protein GWO04_15280, partial [Actinobacteria bacterium]|nr:hypothetical protein [Actinomycetota bacterium]
VAGEFRAWNGSDFVTLANSDVDGTAYFMAATNIVVRSNDITGGMNALIFNDVYHVDVLGNVIHDARSDLLRITGDSSDFDIAYNYLVETHSVAGDHPDMIQLLARNGQTPDNIRIVGNNLYDDPDTGSTPAQGIFFNDAAADGYRHVLIENNIVHSGSANGVYMSGGTENVLIKDNLLTVMPDGSGGSLRIVEDDGNHNRGTTVTGNTVRRILDETSDFSAGIVIENNTFQNVPGSPPTGTPTIGVLPSSPASPPPSPPPPVSPPPAPSGDVQVSNAQELAAALASAPAGGTIVLAAGDYGALNLTGVSFASNVTIKAETALGARFSTVQLSNTDHLAFEGISVSGEFRAWQGSDAISLV